MRFDPDRHWRRSVRLEGHDYAEPGACFVTVCTRDRACLFGHVVNGDMHLNEAGETAQRCWEDIPHHFPHAALDAMAIMPNHVHGVIVITEPPPTPPSKGEASVPPDMSEDLSGSHASPLRNVPSAPNLDRCLPSYRISNPSPHAKPTPPAVPQARLCGCATITNTLSGMRQN